VHVTRADLYDGPCIAINGALLHHPVPFTHWIGLDEPGRFIPDEVKEPWGPNPPPIVIAKRPNADKWTCRWPTLQYDIYEEDREKLAAMLPWKKTKVHWMHYSMLGALHYATVHGARRIRVLGADMAGEHYAYTDKPVVNGKKGPDRRWADEHMHFAAALEEIRAAGIEVERATPARMNDEEAARTDVAKEPDPAQLQAGAHGQS